jgi:hypothetical protein
LYCATLTDGSSGSNQPLEWQVDIAVYREVLRDDDAKKQDRAEAGQLQAAAAELHRARGDDRQHVEDDK